MTTGTIGSEYHAVPGRKLPPKVISMLLDFNGWLVGSACPWFMGDSDKEPGDFDVIIPPHRWCEAMRSWTDYIYSINSFGGVKFDACGHTVDVWPSYLDDYYRMGGTKDPVYALSLNPRVYLKRGLDKLP